MISKGLGIVLVFDEVMTSRLGPSGVQGLVGITPDLTTLGKFWGGGFAFGAFGGSAKLMRHFDTRSGSGLSQAGTFNNTVITMTAGLVGARDVYTPDACNRLNATGDSLRAQINELGRSLGVAFQSTGIGGVQSIHWTSEKVSDPSNVTSPTSPVRRLFQLEMLAHGYYVTQRGMLNLSLPIQEQDLAGFINCVRAFLIRHAALLPRAA